MRLDKFLAYALTISRNEVNRLIRAKRVTVNDEFVKSGAIKLLDTDIIKFDDVALSNNIASPNRYFILHKPLGYVCANDDANYPSVTVLLNEPSAHLLHSAGRLDVDTTGLVLLTDDGNWSHRITSPKNLCQKVYIAELKVPLKESDIEAFAAGLQLHKEKTLTAPAKLEILSEKTAKVTISEGRYHQVKRMFAAVGNRVLSLHRLQIGSIALDDSLPEGEYRELTQAEIDEFN